MRIRVVIVKGWAEFVFGDGPLPEGATFVSEHTDKQEALDAFDRLKAALQKAREDDGSVKH
jgi:hypothetical protein